MFSVSQKQSCSGFLPHPQGERLGVLPVKLGSTNCGLQAGLKANCTKEFKTFLSCPEIALTTWVFPDIYVVTPTEGFPLG